MNHLKDDNLLYDIAIIGMAGRFPGAETLDQFWENLRNGTESITVFSDRELRAAGVDPGLLADPHYVKAKAVLSGSDCFDARFFGVNPREAAIMDPQLRLFLELAWQALEHAGYAGARCEERIGVYAGKSQNTYLVNHLYPLWDELGKDDIFQVVMNNEKDFLSTHVSYRLNLHGPSFSVQTACSTALVAVHLACQGLLNRECDTALAGAVTLKPPQIAGYIFRPEGIVSPDGHCRPFDVRAQGSVPGNGAGLVVLKRLADALRDGDTIHAVIKGSAVNNDGLRKIGYTAPSEDGQVEVISEALAAAAVPAGTVTYVETHGTGTLVGDPIEIAALTRAFRATTAARGFCAIGSVKGNIGHLDTAAGMAGLIKTVMALKHKQLPPSLNFAEANPKIDFANSPFYVNTSLRAWRTDGLPRRAGVSAFGIGGTNAHLILEEAPPAATTAAGREAHLVLLSAKTAEALEGATANLAAHLRRHPELDPADLAYTLQTGRRSFTQRRMLVCKDSEDAAAALEAVDPGRVSTASEPDRHRPLFFMFPGQGAQYVNMGRGLYDREPLFRGVLDRCAGLLQKDLGCNLLEVLYPVPGTEAAAAERLAQTGFTQPALLVIEYALAELWMAWGLKPEALIGHSIGEYTAACLAGVFTLENVLPLVAQRGQLIQALPGGSMLSVSLPEAEVQDLIKAPLSLAAVNAPALCSISGPDAAIAALRGVLEERGVECRRLHTSHAFHSSMLEPILDRFRSCVERADPRSPKMPFVSNVTGTWITARDAADPRYWTKHLRQTVQMADGLKTLLATPDQVLLEVGPGRTLCTLARQQQARAAWSSLPGPQDRKADYPFLLSSLGRLWLAGLPIDWRAFYGNERRRRVPLPTYPFARDRYWIEPPRQAEKNRSRLPALSGKTDPADWFSVPYWRQSLWPRPGEEPRPSLRWLVFGDGCGFGPRIIERLKQMGREVVTVLAGEKFARVGEGTYVLNPGRRGDYDALFGDLGCCPARILHLLNVTAPAAVHAALDCFEKNLESSFYSLLFLVQAIGTRERPADESIRIGIVSNHMQEVIGGEGSHPEKAALLGPCKVIPREYPGITCCSIDLAGRPAENQIEEEWIDHLIQEAAAETPDAVIAFRGKQRFAQKHEPLRLEGLPERSQTFRPGGVYLITGGLGGIGLTIADYLAGTAQAKLILTGRSAFPDRGEWDQWLGAHDAQDPTSRKIRKLKVLEEAGAEVLAVSADVTDWEQMRGVFVQARKRFGDIHGVFHCAGIAGGGVLQLKTAEAAHEVLAPKVKGTLILETLFRDGKPDFMMLSSSTASILGTIGQADYCAANAFLDAFAQSRAGLTPFTVAINWDMWQEVGMAVDTDVPPGLRQEREENLKQGIKPREGMEALGRILNRRLNRIVVATQELPAFSDQAADPARRPAPDETKQTDGFQPVYPRPALANAYAAPGDEAEQKIAAIWQELLGVERIGIHDNFFDLGGHSLLIVQMQTRIEAHFNRNVPVAHLFQYPTIRDMAGYLGQASASDLTEVEDWGREYRAALQRQKKQK